MKTLKAVWSVDTTAFEDINRGYPMTIEPGGLYEVWLPLDDHPKPAVAIGLRSDIRGNMAIWDVLTDGQVITQRAGRIFKTGTATPVKDAIGEMSRMILDQISREEDAKILKSLSEMEKEEGHP